MADASVRAAMMRRMERERIRTFQKVLNNFTDKRLLAVPRIEEDGIDGQQTRNRALQCKWWLGYTDEQRDRELDRMLLWRLRNPLTQSSYQGRAAIERGQLRRDKQKERVRRREDDDVASPLTFTQDSWGYGPGHDGIDLICGERAPLFAMTDGVVVRADAGGWWGNNPTGDVSKGDGIIIVRCSVNEGPFFPRLNLCYGHAEGAVVRAGQKVEAGQRIGEAGFANAHHIHFMVNDNDDARGVGDRDPRPFVDYAVEHGRS